VARIDNTQLRHFPAKLLTLGVLPGVNSYCPTASEKEKSSAASSKVLWLLSFKKVTGFYR